MNNSPNYMQFLKEHGRPLSEINPGSDEVALKLEDALQAIEFLIDAQFPILGGDILSDESGKLVYTYENWYCEKQDQETQDEYRKRSYYTSKTYIEDLIKKKYRNHYVVIVV